MQLTAHIRVWLAQNARIDMILLNVCNSFLFCWFHHALCSANFQFYFYSHRNQLHHWPNEEWKWPNVLDGRAQHNKFFLVPDASNSVYIHNGPTGRRTKITTVYSFARCSNCSKRAREKKTCHENYICQHAQQNYTKEEKHWINILDSETLFRRNGPAVRVYTSVCALHVYETDLNDEGFCLFGSAAIRTMDFHSLHTNAQTLSRLQISQFRFQLFNFSHAKWMTAEENINTQTHTHILANEEEMKRNSNLNCVYLSISSSERWLLFSSFVSLAARLCCTTRDRNGNVMYLVSCRMNQKIFAIVFDCDRVFCANLFLV